MSLVSHFRLDTRMTALLGLSALAIKGIAVLVGEVRHDIDATCFDSSGGDVVVGNVRTGFALMLRPDRALERKPSSTAFVAGVRAA